MVKTNDIRGFGIVATIAEASATGLEAHHVADIAIGIAFTLGPVGWVGGLTYTGLDLLSQGLSGNSLTENFFKLFD